MAVVEVTALPAWGTTTFVLLTRYARVAHEVEELWPLFALLPDEGAT
jgi:hypothetical protein